MWLDGDWIPRALLPGVYTAETILNKPANTTLTYRHSTGMPTVASVRQTKKRNTKQKDQKS